MTATDLIAATIAQRTASGLSLKAYGAEGVTVADPFTAHAKDAAQLAKWQAVLQARGFTVETI